MRKSTSKRRWKAKCRLRNQTIPMQAIVEHQLNRWFDFKPANPAYSCMYIANWPVMITKEALGYFQKNPDILDKSSSP